MRATSRKLVRTLATIAMLGYLGLLYGLMQVWFRQDHSPETRSLVSLRPFRMIQFYIDKGGWEFFINIVCNVGVLIPWGFLLPIVVHRPLSWLKILACSFGLSFFIEFSQWWSQARVADIDDVLLNTLGGLLGYAILRQTPLLPSQLTMPRPGFEPGTPC